MTASALRAVGIGKQYRIGAREARYQTAREALTGALLGPARKLASLFRGEAKEKEPSSFWALNDVSFEIAPGEVVGVIGRNGAGKSTLLKVLSGITEPTRGFAEVRGRLGVLLEVGTGFHPELSGRENIFLNGAILGMTREEIARKFDEMVAFSGVERFVDTAVKHYSSGMYLRLAFSVAAHLEPDILVVDEVLAVGDMEFQKKCLGKMQDVARGGRTVLLVSHNMTAISGLCTRALFLKDGRVDFDGDVMSAVKRYASSGVAAADADLDDDRQHYGPRRFARITRMTATNGNSDRSDSFVMGEPLVVRVEVDCHESMPAVEIGVALKSKLGVTIHCLVSTWEGLDSSLELGKSTFEMRLPTLLVHPGNFMLGAWVKVPGASVDDEVGEGLGINVLGADLTGFAPGYERYTSSGSEVFARSEWKRLA